MVHPIQARKAFVDDRGNVRFFTLERADYLLDKAWVSLERIWLRKPADQAEAERRRSYDYHYGDDYWLVDDPARLHALLARTDLTRHDGRPLVAANRRKHVLALAVGPAIAPKRLAISGVFDLARQVLVAADATQPEWWCLDAVTVDPFNGTTNAKYWASKWEAQAAAGEQPSWN